MKSEKFPERIYVTEEDTGLRILREREVGEFYTLVEYIRYDRYMAVLESMVKTIHLLSGMTG